MYTLFEAVHRKAPKPRGKTKIKTFEEVPKATTNIKHAPLLANLT